LANKKALSYTVVVLLLLALVGGGILLWFSGRFADTVEKGGDRATCKNSVVLRAKNPLEIGEISCKTNYVTIDTLEQKKIMQTISEEAYWCWWQFAEGKADFLDPEWVRADTWCFLCSTIEFSDKVKEKYPEGIRDFNIFLQETSLKPKYDGNYIDYLPVSSQAEQSISTIPTQTPFNIAFFGVKKENIPTLPSQHLFALGPFGRYYISGMLYSSTDIKNVCNTLVVGEPSS